MKFGEKVKIIREFKGIKAEELAAKTGFTAPYIYSLENGSKDNPPLKTIKAIANAIGADPGFLINEKAVDFLEMARSTGVDLPADIVEWIMSQKSTPYLILAKTLDEENLSLDQVEKAIAFIRSVKRN